MGFNRANNIPLFVFLVTALSLLTHTVVPAADASAGTHIDIAKLKGRIIRSLSVASFDANNIIAGNKGSNPGDATIFASANGGLSWRFLNQNRPLHSDATDVQAVSFVSPQIVLAGTWKHGLFRSTNGGATFEAVAGFKPKDVRSLLVSATRSETVYAGTGSNGMLVSTDAGITWRKSGLDNGYLWSIRERPGSTELAASSPTAGLFLSTNTGDSWQHHLKGINVYETVFSAQNSGTIVAATDDGLYVSFDSGQQWQQPEPLRGKRLSSVRIGTDEDTVIAGDWKNGLWRYSLTNDNASQSHAELPVLHIQATAKALLVATWGQGFHILTDSTQSSYLIDAAKSGDNKTVNTLLAAGVDPDVFDASRNTALIFASRDGHLEIGDKLIAAGASVNWIDGEGVTPLILAAHKNHLSLAKLLLANGADPSVVDRFGHTAEHYAKRRGTDDKIFMLLTKNQ